MVESRSDQFGAGTHNPFVDGEAASTISYTTTANPYQASTISHQPDDTRSAGTVGSVLWWLLFSFRGRIPRRAYWGAYLLTILLLFGGLVGTFTVFGEESAVSMAVAIMLYVLLLWINLALSVKRYHDRDKSGWWVLIALIPYAGPIWQLVDLGCLRGTRGRNSYGDDPTDDIPVGRRGWSGVYRRDNREEEPDFSKWGK